MEIQLLFQGFKRSGRIFKKFTDNILPVIEKATLSKSKEIWNPSEIHEDAYVILIQGEGELPILRFEQVFCIYYMAQYFRRDLDKISFAGVSTNKLLCHPPHVMLGREQALNNMKIKLDLYQSPRLKENNYVKATVLDKESYAELLIEYLIQYHEAKL